MQLRSVWTHLTCTLQQTGTPMLGHPSVPVLCESLPPAHSCTMAYNTRLYITDITRDLKNQLGQKLSFHTGREVFEKMKIHILISWVATTISQAFYNPECHNMNKHGSHSLPLCVCYRNKTQ